MERTKDLIIDQQQSEVTGKQFPAYPAELSQLHEALNAEPTRTNIEKYGQRIVELVSEGLIDPLPLVVRLKALSELFEQVRKSVTEDVLNDLQKYNEKELVEKLGAKIERMEAGISYDYSMTGDIGWEQLNADMLALKERIKERETFLKAIKNPVNITDEMTMGQECTVHPAIRKSTSTFKITLAK